MKGVLRVPLVIGYLLLIGASFLASFAFAFVLIRMGIYFIPRGETAGEMFFGLLSLAVGLVVVIILVLKLRELLRDSDFRELIRFRKLTRD